ncbi:hypothetical protein PoB_007640500 [Plakobranchus ocellatus]|uniref:Uncharacterized protein n=1 Tax=Plakobranchus ocellatus TaxID=259542 RepID=A0AAV4E0H5_9GAST|nr:hypothetical protein PoB_007640500 [Plakobranchus ocellatus]
MSADFKEDPRAAKDPLTYLLVCPSYPLPSSPQPLNPPRPPAFVLTRGRTSRCPRGATSRRDLGQSLLHVLLKRPDMTSCPQSEQATPDDVGKVCRIP